MFCKFIFYILKVPKLYSPKSLKRHTMKIIEPVFDEKNIFLRLCRCSSVYRELSTF